LLVVGDLVVTNQTPVTLLVVAVEPVGIYILKMFTSLLRLFRLLSVRVLLPEPLAAQPTFPILGLLRQLVAVLALEVV
jgi:hypothetical protein